jgi:predicted Zn-dependent protease
MITLGTGGPAFLRTHPASADRIRDLQANTKKVVPLYQTAFKPCD